MRAENKPNQHLVELTVGFLSGFFIARGIQRFFRVLEEREKDKIKDHPDLIKLRKEVSRLYQEHNTQRFIR